ncbi:diguanylate cyclase (GGDEF) domain-containing protein [Methylobacterium sp. 174MFSha1.1]|uniref:GGDEF domain-containing protein n=1 Tax=Methylobacterium sp. 174MFSha1.1 TaxID=1502749 RepID=UPI0008E0EA31|nr:GGDEF domain-containing protein [Methylobacterium sp. 174MFSha1.1]SFV05584.1 diguanylate cyclase (GGDEF) domain-containing protein [Methylobacterium sp. 174MFSha1.1]
MPSLPDIATLRLCSSLATSAFAAVFLVLWAGRRGETHWPCWAAGAAAYAVILAGFAASTHHLVTALLFAALGVTFTVILVGVRLFEGRRGTPAWLWGLGLAPGLAYALPLAGLRLHIDDAAAWPCRLLGTLLLAANTVAVGGILLFGRVAEPSRGRRIAGVALFGYLPSYAAGIAFEAIGLGSLELAALLPMLSDQLLLGLLNLGLLAMPGERAQARLRLLAERDPLTGALNRAGLAAAMPGAPPAGTAAVLIDIDHFKALNDGHGHAVGDAVLKALVRVVTARLPSPRDLVVRLGGDEFAIVLRATTLPEALALAERVRIASRDVPGLPAWTASLGVALSRPDDRTLADTMARADGALYRAKASGRDRAA